MNDSSYSFYRSEEPGFGIEGDLPVTISSTGHETRSSRDYRWNNERHSFSRRHIFQYTLSGKGTFEYSRDGSPVREGVGPGGMFIASWDRSFEYYFDGGEPWEFLWISVEGSFADRAAAALGDPRPIVDLPRESAPIALLWDFHDRLAGSSRVDRYALAGIGHDFLLQLLKERSRSGAGPEERFLLEARSFVTRHLRTARVATLAAHFGYSEKYFNEYFKRRASVTPNRFIVEERMRYAATLLVNTSKKISAVARELGFAEDNYFSKVFKRRFGLPPAEYRERNRDTVPANEIVIL